MMTLFNNTNTGTALAVPYDTNTTGVLAGGGSTYRRLSIRGSAFREIVSGQEVHVYDRRTLDVVILAAAPINRTYFEEGYKEGEAVPPICWSTDGKAPSEAVTEENRQSDKCQTCPMNVKGSGQGDSRACRFQQRLAIAIVDENDEVGKEVYQLAVPSASIFGDAEPGKRQLPLQAFGRLLHAHKTPAEAIVTELRLDPSSSTPKLTFEAKRPLTPEEFAAVQELRQDEATTQAITFTVSQMDRVTDKAEAPKQAVKETKEAPKADTKPKQETKRSTKRADPAPQEEVPEPKIGKSGKTTSPPAESVVDVSKLVAEWDD